MFNIWVDTISGVVTNANTDGTYGATNAVALAAPVGLPVPLIVNFHTDGTPVNLDINSAFILVGKDGTITGTGALSAASFTGVPLVYLASSSGAGAIGTIIDGATNKFELVLRLQSNPLATVIGNRVSMVLDLQLVWINPGVPDGRRSLVFPLTLSNSVAQNSDVAPAATGLGPRNFQWISPYAGLLNAVGISAWDTIQDAVAGWGFETEAMDATFFFDFAPTPADLAIDPNITGSLRFIGPPQACVGNITAGLGLHITLQDITVASVAFSGGAGATSQLTLLGSAAVTGDVTFAAADGVVGDAGIDGPNGGTGPTVGAPGTAGTSLASSITGDGCITGNVAVSGGAGGNGGVGGNGDPSTISTTGGSGATGGDGGAMGTLTLTIAQSLQIAGTVTLAQPATALGGTGGAAGADTFSMGTGSVGADGSNGSVITAVLSLQPIRTLGGVALSNLHSHLPTAAPTGTLQFFNDNGIAKIIDDASVVRIIETGDTNVAATIHDAASKTTPVDADELGLVDSAASNVLKKLTWANLKATLKTYFDGIYSTFNGAYSSLSGKPTLGTAAALDVGTTASHVVQLDGSAKLPAVDGSQLTGVTADVAGAVHAATGKTTPVDADELGLVDSAASNVLKKLTWANLKATLKTYFDGIYSTFNGAYSSLSGKPTLGTAAALDVGTTASHVVQLDGSAKLPAVDGSQLTGVTADVAGAVHAATGKTTPVDADELGLVDSAASNVLKKLTWANLKATLKTYFDGIYSTFNGAYSSLSGKPTLGTAAALDVGTTASHVVQLDGSGKLPAVDGSQLTGITGGGGVIVGTGTVQGYTVADAPATSPNDITITCGNSPDGSEGGSVNGVSFDGFNGAHVGDPTGTAAALASAITSLSLSGITATTLFSTYVVISNSNTGAAAELNVVVSGPGLSGGGDNFGTDDVPAHGDIDSVLPVIAAITGKTLLPVALLAQTVGGTGLSGCTVSLKWSGGATICPPLDMSSGSAVYDLASSGAAISDLIAAHVGESIVIAINGTVPMGGIASVMVAAIPV